MILKLKRVEYERRMLKPIESAQYSITDKNEKIINQIKREFDNEKLIFDINYNGKKVTLNVPKFKYESVIYEENNVVGHIAWRESKKIVDVDYSWIMKYNDREFDLYEVGYGNNGIYFVIKENDETVAIISKELITKNFNDSYEIFVENDANAIIAIICCLYWDSYRGTSWVKDGASGINTMNHTLTTISSKIKEKMDFEFIEKIAKQENYTINNKTKEVRKASTVGWILLVVCIIIILMIL